MTDKRILIRTMTTIVMLAAVIISQTVPVYAGELVSDAGETVAVVSDAVVEGYEASVVAQMIGRAGAASPYGAKGVAFEVLYKDYENLKNFFCIFKPVERMVLSESSTDTLADLVLTDSKGGILGLIQCKDGTSYSQVRKIIQQVTDGYYEGSKIVGTSECAEAFNKAAVKAGIDARIVNSGISTELTEKIAKKAVGGSLKFLAKQVGGGVKTGGLFFGGIGAIESVIKGDSFAEGVANTTVEAVKGAGSIGAAKAVATLVTMGFAAFNAPSIVSATGVFVAATIAGGVVISVLDKLNEGARIQEGIAAGVDKVMMGTAEIIVKTGDAVGKATNEVRKAACEVGKGAAACVTEIASATKGVITDTGKFLGGVLNDFR